MIMEKMHNKITKTEHIKIKIYKILTKTRQFWFSVISHMTFNELFKNNNKMFFFSTTRGHNFTDFWVQYKQKTSDALQSLIHFREMDPWTGSKCCFTRYLEVFEYRIPNSVINVRVFLCSWNQLVQTHRWWSRTEQRRIKRSSTQ